MHTVFSRTDKRTCLHFATSYNYALSIAVELPTEDRQATDAVDRLLAEISQISFEQGVAALAHELGERLRAADGKHSQPAWVFFAGVEIRDSAITACVAGPHRIHLLKHDAIVASTREHILRHDSPPPDWPEEAAPEVDVNLHGTVVTRSLGASASRAPEVTVWSSRRPFTVLLVSADLHRHQESTSYVERLRTRPALDDRLGGSFFIVEAN
jgi:hypothetical protein